MCACLKILRKVPLETSLCFGTIAVMIPFAAIFANLIWLPVCPASENPDFRSFFLRSALDRLHAAISNSNCLTLGNTVATGGVKCSARAS